MKEKTYEVSRKDSFRPLAGIMVLIAVKTANTKKKGRPSFRPLAGIMVLIFWR